MCSFCRLKLLRLDNPNGLWNWSLIHPFYCIHTVATYKQNYYDHYTFIVNYNRLDINYHNFNKIYARG